MEQRPGFAGPLRFPRATADLRQAFEALCSGRVGGPPAFAEDVSERRRPAADRAQALHGAHACHCTRNDGPSNRVRARFRHEREERPFSAVQLAQLKSAEILLKFWEIQLR